MTLRLEWEGTGRRPQVKPNPDYPNGCVIDAGGGADKVCRIALPYPADSIGVHIVICDNCGLRIGITAASRPDDPREFIMACGRRRGRAVKRAWEPSP